jgi:hypothetical protein
MPAQTEYEIPTGWGTSPYTDLELPSGGRCLAKRLDFEVIVAADLVDEFDKLSPTVEEKVIGPAKGKKPADRPKKKPTKKEAAATAAEEQKAFFKSDGFATMISMMARVIPLIVIKPKVHSAVEQVDGKWVTIPPEDREEGSVYSDSIPLADQMHIFMWAMDGMDMEGLSQFREQSEPGVGAVESVKEPADAAE